MMTEAEWLSSEDPIAMLDALRATWRGKEAELVRSIHCYLLDCCRAIWPLLPLERTRHGVEVAERYIVGRATRDDLSLADYQSEGAMFFLERFWDDVWADPETRFGQDSLEARVRASLEADAKAEGPEVWAERLRYEAERKARIEAIIRDVGAIPMDELRRLVRLEREGPVDLRSLLENAAYFANTAISYPLYRSRDKAVERFPEFLSARLLRRVIGRLHRPKRSAVN